MPSHLTHICLSRARVCRRPGRLLRPLAAIVTAMIVASPESSRAATAPAALRNVVVQPDGAGARILVAVDGPFHYLVDRRGDRVVIVLDPVSAAAADHPLSVGPVRSVRVRSIAGAPPRAEITVFTSGAIAGAASFVDGSVLAVTLLSGAARNVPAAHPGGAVSAFQPADRAPSERIAGRAVVNRVITLDEGTGRLLDVDHLARVAVSDPRIVGVIPVSARELLVTARTPGHATVYVWEGRDRIAAYTVEVRAGEDPFRDLRRALAALLPGASITVTEVHGSRAGAPAASPVAPPAPAPVGAPLVPGPGPVRAAAPYVPAVSQAAVAVSSAAAGGARGVVLSGTVDTQQDRAKAEDVARAFVGSVVDLLTVRRPVQLSLQVEVVELSRTAQQSLGITWGGGQQAPGSPPSLNGGVYNLQLITAPGISTNGLDLLIAQIDALSQRGQARLLARPGLVVLAGRTASLLLGGQVPVPVAGANGTVTIEYKDFGVILSARPEYQDDGGLFLQITPEVSTLDFTDAIKVSGFEIPALRVRRAQTTVAMRPGETLVLGGLLQREDVQMAQKVPLLADLPVIGALFRSRSFQRHESDLLILVTPRLVEPSHTP